MGLAADVAERAKSPLPLAKAAQRIYATAIQREPYLERKDFSSVYLYLQKAAEKDD
jgi:3-hydroxyisobutyrate dehydrogenase